MSQSTLPTNQAAFPETWAEKLFQIMEDSYGSLWVDRYAGLDRERVKRTWSERLSGYSGAEIKRGIDATMQSKFPPTLPEFLQLCRPAADHRVEWAEACEQMRIRLQGRGDDRWSRPEVYWAAVAIGAYDLNALAWEQIRARWEGAIACAKSDPIPEYRAALPPPGRTTTTSEEGHKRLQALGVDGIGRASEFRNEKGEPIWALRIFGRYAAGQYDCERGISAAEEVLGRARPERLRAAI